VVPRRCVGVDWSGAADARAAARAIWCAVVDDGCLVALENGRDRAATTAFLIELAFTEPETLVGLDFCFSAPAWFLAAQGMRSAGELWRWAARCAEADPDFVSALPEPFWGPRLRPRPVLAGDPLRATEHATAATGARPVSIFQVSGAGSVGAQSLRGMPELLVLCDAGISVWPFDPPRLPLAVEVFPRAVARALAPPGGPRSGAAFRAVVVERHAAAFGSWADLACANQDAFDAAVTALGLAADAGLVGRLDATRSVQDPREGAIVVPEPGPCR
jgi:hypothetical protein